MFKENFLHYIWRYKLFTSFNLNTIEGEALEVISVGTHNFDGGPDFFNSKVKIGETLWAGNVEIHINSSDWIKHKHQHDKAYQNVVLHVVYQHDKEILNRLGQAIPTLELKNIIDEKLVDNYQQLLVAKDWIPCAKQIRFVNDFIIKAWQERLVVERLERKVEEITATLKLNKNDWEETFYQYLFKYFGLKINALPFELLAKNTPLKIINKHNQPIEIEALLYGQAGFLEDQFEDDYFITLKKNYHFLKKKFSLCLFDKSLWKFMRLRPNNFPTIRISQLANLLNRNPRLFSSLLEINKIDEMQDVFKVKASSYWNNHYQFGISSSKNIEKKIGTLLSNNLLINVIVPIIFVYAKAKDDENLINKALRLLVEIQPENNIIIKKWADIGIIAANALQSQSLIELKNNYCSQKKCLNCGIGNEVLKQ